MGDLVLLLQVVTLVVLAFFMLVCFAKLSDRRESAEAWSGAVDHDLHRIRSGLEDARERLHSLTKDMPEHWLTAIDVMTTNSTLVNAMTVYWDSSQDKWIAEQGEYAGVGETIVLAIAMMKDDMNAK